MVTGVWFVVGGLPDGKRELSDEASDVNAAHHFLETWSERDSGERFHLGRPLAQKAEAASPSFHLLQRLQTGESTRALPGLLDGRPRRSWHQLAVSLPAPMLPSRRFPQERLSLSHMPKDAFRSRPAPTEGDT